MLLRLFTKPQGQLATNRFAGIPQFLPYASHPMTQIRPCLFDALRK